MQTDYEILKACRRQLQNFLPSGSPVYLLSNLTSFTYDTMQVAHNTTLATLSFIGTLSLLIRKFPTAFSHAYLKSLSNENSWNNILSFLESDLKNGTQQ